MSDNQQCWFSLGVCGRLKAEREHIRAHLAPLTPSHTAGSQFIHNQDWKTHEEMSYTF